LLLWMAPVILGLLLSIPIAMLTAKASNNSRLFRTPEESAPPRILVRANELASAAGAAIERPLLELRSDPRLLDAHLMNLPRDRSRSRGQIDPHLAIARAKIEDAETLDEAMGYLTSREEFAVLGSPSILRALHAKPPHAQGRE
jgi:membrane glycosyltransferase